MYTIKYLKFRAWEMPRAVFMVYAVKFQGLGEEEKWCYGYHLENGKKRYIIFREGADNAVLWDLGRVSRKDFVHIAALASERDELKELLGDKSPKIEEWEQCGTL